ncbi:transporter substrate-binding domain-containing protein [Vibrio mimicus]
MLLRLFVSALLLFFSYSGQAAQYLDATEQSYLRQKSELTIAVLKEVWMPYWGGLDGQPMGIEHDFASGIAAELEVGIRYQGYDTIEALLDGVKSGQADLAIGFGKTQQREGEFLFSEPLYENVRVIWLRDKELAEQPFENLKWVCIQGTSYCELIMERGYKNILMARNYSSSVEMIRQGVADATITNYVSLNAFLSKNRISSGQVIFDEKLGTQVNRVLINTDEPLLLSAINKVINADKVGLTQNKLNSLDVYFLNDQENLNLLRDENHNTAVKYTLHDDTFPLSYWDDKEKKYKGYVHDLLERISLRSILKFEFVPANGRNVEDMLRNGEVDVIPAYNMSNIDSRDFLSVGVYDYLSFGHIETLLPYSTEKLAILDRTGNFYQYLYSQEKIKYAPVYRSVDELMQALQTGSVTHALVNKSLINQWLINGESNVFKLTDLSKTHDVNVDVTMVVRKSSSVLQNMLHKVLATFTPQEIEEIKSSYNKVTVKYGYDKEQVIIYALIAVCILLALGLLFTLWVTRLRGLLKNTQHVAQLSTEQIQWLTELLDAIPSMIYISDDEGDVVLTNAAYRDAMGACHANDCLNNLPDCSFLQLPDSSTSEYSVVIQIPARPCAIGEHYYHVIRRGIAHPINRRQYYLTLFNDITELKETESALRQSTAQALQAVEARNHFLAVVSHELRTPIAAMLGLMEILASRIKSNESQLLLTNAITSAERLKMHVNDILDFSKIEAQQLQLDVATYHLADELCPLLRSFEATADLQGLDFIVNWQPDARLLVQVDALRLNQIITNLLSNALKFTEKGSIRICVEQSEQHFTFEVSDTGCGMTEPQIASIFQPFVQADSSITRRFGGTGLGMSIVANLVELMGGHIHVESEIDQGTTVRVSLPVVGEALTQFQGCELPLAKTSPLKGWAEALGVVVVEAPGMMECIEKNIYPDALFKLLNDLQAQNTKTPAPKVMTKLVGHALVADDDPINRLLIRKQLNELGVQSTIVCDGQEALNQLMASPEQFDLVITDCHMPKMDGFELTRQIKGLATFAEKPVLGCTAEDSRIAAEKAKQCGMDRVIYKPYSLALLHRVLSRYLPVCTSDTQESYSWLDDYHTDERAEMAQVVLDSFSHDIELLNQPDADDKAIGHRIKGAAGALNLTELASLAKAVELPEDPQKLVENKQALINGLHVVVEQARHWLSEHESE